MKVIFNDKSLHGQFKDFDEADDYFSEAFIKMFNVLSENEIMLYKSVDTFNCYVTSTCKLVDLLQMSGMPFIAVLRKIIQNPYLDDIPADGLEEFFSDAKLLTVDKECNEKFDNRTVSYVYDEVDCELEQFCSLKGELTILLHEYPDKLVYTIQKYPYVNNTRVRVTKTATKDLEEVVLTKNDAVKIVKEIDDMLHSMLKGAKTRWWDILDRDNSIFEYRQSISSNREYRITFVRDREITLLTAFVKKEESTRKSEIDRAKNVKSRLADRCCGA